MNVADLFSRPVFTVQAQQPLAEAARQMLERDVGALVVVREAAGKAYPVGIITDRDIVCGQFTRQADLHCLTVGELMSSPAHCVTDAQSAEEAIALMRTRGVRRAPVVNTAGEIVGMITLDDLLPAVAGELELLAGVVASGRRPRHPAGH